jgi:hypothetical protein
MLWTDLERTIKDQIFIRLIFLYTFFNCLNIKDEQTLLYGYFKIIKGCTLGIMYNGKYLLKIMVSVSFSNFKNWVKGSEKKGTKRYFLPIKYNSKICMLMCICNTQEGVVV